MGGELIPAEAIESRIFLVRGHRVMIDRDIAALYGVETKYLNRQVKRNIQRFPKEFAFRLNKNEKRELVTICHRLDPIKHSSSMPYVFTEHVIAMLATVLSSKRAISVSIIIIKTFIKLRRTLANYKEFASILHVLQKKVDRHDKKIAAIFNTIQEFLNPLSEIGRNTG